MSSLEGIVKTKDESTHPYADFWQWFSENASVFHKVIAEEEEIEKDFFEKLAPKLDAIKEGLWYLTGMYDENTVELILTADGEVTNIVFVEQLIQAAPQIDGWRFTALKPALDIQDVNIEMDDYWFNSEKLHFYASDHPNYPGEVDVTIVYDDYSEDNKDLITNGVYIFLDNYLGELDFASTIDNLDIIGRAEAPAELIPIEKLKSYLTWRQKEFIEKYEGTRHNIENDQYSGLEAKLKDGKPVLAVINTDVLQWDSKASHPWVLTVEIQYNGSKSNGMPDRDTFQRLDQLEERLLEELKDSEGYLHIGRETANNTREVYFACKDFRKPSLVLFRMQGDYADIFDISYKIYKDKYWQSFNRFNQVA